MAMLSASISIVPPASSICQKSRRLRSRRPARPSDVAKGWSGPLRSLQKIIRRRIGDAQLGAGAGLVATGGGRAAAGGAHAQDAVRLGQVPRALARLEGFSSPGLSAAGRSGNATVCAKAGPPRPSISTAADREICDIAHLVEP